MSVSGRFGEGLAKYGILAAVLIGGGYLIWRWFEENNPFKKVPDEIKSGQDIVNSGGTVTEDNTIWEQIGGGSVQAPADVGGYGELTFMEWLDKYILHKETVQTNVQEVTGGNAPAAWSGDIPPEADILQMAKNEGAYHSGIQPIESVMGLQGIGLTETILQDVSPTLMLVEKEYNAPNVHTSEVVFQDVWGGIIGPNLASQSDPDEVGACLARGGGWNWNTRECI